MTGTAAPAADADETGVAVADASAAGAVRTGVVGSAGALPLGSSSMSESPSDIIVLVVWWK